jgi:hypothetical protein
MDDVKRITVHSMYWKNIPDQIRQGQKAVFDYLNIPLIQECADRVSHGVWMNEVIERYSSDEVIVFCDIDAFPLSLAAYEKAVGVAEQGGIFGLAQYANHHQNMEIYAGPMFMAFQKRTWENLGCPDLKSNDVHDAAEVMSLLARQKGVELRLEMPTSCLIPKWSLAHHGVFGIGTFYGECEFFHLFESRLPAYGRLFEQVVSDTLSGKNLDFNKYLEITKAHREGVWGELGKLIGRIKSKLTNVF